MNRKGDGLGLKKVTSSQDGKKKGCEIVIDWSWIDKSVVSQLTTVRRSCRMWRDEYLCVFVDYFLQRLALHLKRCLLDNDFLQRLSTEIDRCCTDCNAWGPDFCQDAAIEHQNYRKEIDLQRIYRDDSKLKWASDGERHDGEWRMVFAYRGWASFFCESLLRWLEPARAPFGGALASSRQDRTW